MSNGITDYYRDPYHEFFGVFLNKQLCKLCNGWTRSISSAAITSNILEMTVHIHWADEMAVFSL